MEKHLIAEFNTHAREPVLRRMTDNSLVCTFLTGGTGEPQLKNYVALSKSYDDGKTWTKPTKILEHPSRGMWCTEIFCECQYPFAVVYTYNPDFTHYGELQTFYSATKDNGETWEKPKSFHGSVNGCCFRQGFKLSNGNILFPLYWQQFRDDFEWGGKSDESKLKMVSGAAISEDNGATYQRYGYFEEDFSLWEPNAIEAEPGHIIIYFRNPSGYLYISESFDYGKNWTKVKQSDILNADTKFSLLKIGDNILMINNFTSEKRRTNLCILKSKDGKSFERIFDIEDKDNKFFYPHAFADGNARILYVAYENMKEHYLAKISYEELGL